MEKLALEYLRSASLLEKRINELKRDEPSELERITLLMSERKDLLEQAYYLERYYDTDDSTVREMYS